MHMRNTSRHPRRLRRLLLLLPAAALSDTDASCIDSGDLADHCPLWAQRGECATNPVYMHEHCRRSCGCPAQGPPPPSGECADRDKSGACATWAAAGECDANPAYMKVKCASTCGTCDMLDWRKRCPVDPEAKPAVPPGAMQETFERALSNFPQYSPQLLSSDPYVVTFEERARTRKSRLQAAPAPRVARRRPSQESPPRERAAAPASAPIGASRLQTSPGPSRPASRASRALTPGAASAGLHLRRRGRGAAPPLGGTLCPLHRLGCHTAAMPRLTQPPRHTAHSPHTGTGAGAGTGPHHARTRTRTHRTTTLARAGGRNADADEFIPLTSEIRTSWTTWREISRDEPSLREIAATRGRRAAARGGLPGRPRAQARPAPWPRPGATLRPAWPTRTWSPSRAAWRS